LTARVHPTTPGADEVNAALDRLLIRDALAKLSPQHSAVIVRSYYLQWTTAQIADDLRIPQGTVKSRLHYALRALRLTRQETGVRYDAEVVTAARLDAGRRLGKQHFG
jgi:RNA polymerase sigma-70 factor, ECF subfamily